MTYIDIVRRSFLVLALTCAVLSAFVAPGVAAQDTGRATITTAPGIMASLERSDADMRAVPPAERRMMDRAGEPRATFILPVRSTSPMITLDGALILSSSNRSLTLQDIRIDLRSRKVFVRVKEFFNRSVHAFDLVGDIRSRERPGKSGTLVNVRGATLVVSKDVGNLVNDALGLRGANAVLGPGAVVGSARLTYRERPRA